MSDLNCLKDYFAIHHSEIGPEVFRQAIVPVFEIAVWPPWRHLTTLGLKLRHRVVEPEFWSEAAIELVLKAVHESSIPR